MRRSRIYFDELRHRLYGILLLSFISRVVTFFLLPEKEASVSPDEATYGELTEWITQGNPADEYEFNNLYIISRAFILPATLLNRFGLNGLDSVRIIASLYGVLTLALIAFVLVRIVESRQETAIFVFKNQKIVLILFAYNHLSLF